MLDKPQPSKPPFHDLVYFDVFWSLLWTLEPYLVVCLFCKECWTQTLPERLSGAITDVLLILFVSFKRLVENIVLRLKWWLFFPFSTMQNSPLTRRL